MEKNSFFFLTENHTSEINAFTEFYFLPVKKASFSKEKLHLWFKKAISERWWVFF